MSHLSALFVEIEVDEDALEVPALGVSRADFATHHPPAQVFMPDAVPAEPRLHLFPVRAGGHFLADEPLYFLHRPAAPVRQDKPQRDHATDQQHERDATGKNTDVLATWRWRNVRWHLDALDRSSVSPRKRRVVFLSS